MIKKEMVDARKEQEDLVVMENSGMNSKRDHSDSLHLEKNNNLWSDEDNPHETCQDNYFG